LHSALDIVEVAEDVERSPAEVAEIYSALDGRLNLHWLWRQAAALPSDSHWLGLARKAMLDDVANQLREITAGVFRLAPPGTSCSVLLQTWENRQAYQVHRWEQVRSELQPAGTLDMSMVSVALRELRALVPATPCEPAEAATMKAAPVEGAAAEGAAAS